jgi:CPA1 family monovalent cation:H+ antiporter
MFKINDGEFDNLVLLTLPLLIAADVLKLKLSDLKQHSFSLFWIAVISVWVSILLGVWINDFILSAYPLTIGAIVLLFCMVSATDPITVSAVFSNFRVPHKLKILTEGESLFNDATALIVFSIALIALENPIDVTMNFILIKSLSVVFGAVLIGAIVGMITVLMLRLSSEALVEATIIILSAYVSYLFAEHFHFSGILAVIVSVLMANNTIHKIIHSAADEIVQANNTKNFGLLKHAVTSKENHQTILKSIDFISMFASALLFISIASIIDFEKLWHYKYEILAIFIASTVIRAVMMLKFAIVSKNIKNMQTIQKHWWAVLTFAGSKGALSILMVHMLPTTFQYKELFENIIIGNIILSTFVYAGILAVIINKNKYKFEIECNEEVH